MALPDGDPLSQHAQCFLDSQSEGRWDGGATGKRDSQGIVSEAESVTEVTFRRGRSRRTVANRTGHSRKQQSVKQTVQCHPYPRQNETFKDYLPQCEKLVR